MAPTEADASETITRVLYVTSLVHVYAIPPMSSTKGHMAASWTVPPSRQIFSARLRIVETSTQSPASLSVAILLEDPSSGDLFAGAPYTSPSAVEQALDSSRFFALRVEGEGGRKATLGMGFEERSEAFDFGIALQEARKVLGMGSAALTPSSASGFGNMSPAQNSGRNRRKAGKQEAPLEETSKPMKRDWGLKEGEMLHIDVGNRKKDSDKDDSYIEPPSGGGLDAFKIMPPPPSANKADRRRSADVSGLGSSSTASSGNVGGKKLEELGFDDGEFGEFQ